MEIILPDILKWKKVKDRSLRWFCQYSVIKKMIQTAVINIVFQRIFIKLDVSYASQHTFSKVTVTIFENYIYRKH